MEDEFARAVAAGGVRYRLCFGGPEGREVERGRLGPGVGRNALRLLDRTARVPAPAPLGPLHLAAEGPAGEAWSFSGPLPSAAASEAAICLARDDGRGRWVAVCSLLPRFRPKRVAFYFGCSD